MQYEELLTAQYVALWGSEHVARVVDIMAARGDFRKSTLALLLRSGQLGGEVVPQVVSSTQRLVSEGLLSIGEVLGMMPEVRQLQGADVEAALLSGVEVMLEQQQQQGSPAADAALAGPGGDYYLRTLLDTGRAVEAA